MKYGRVPARWLARSKAKSDGEAFMVTKKDREAAWDRATKVRGKNPETWRRDELGNQMRHGSYGSQGEYGWEIDHKNPVSKGGTDNPRNLRALNSGANRWKSDKT